MNKGVTIIICTYNGIEKLSNTISHIAKLSIPPEIKWEVILADNNSNDNSAAFAINEWKKHGLTSINFRTISQPRPGKFYALQDAINTAVYEYIITCDDDNWLASDYVTRVFTHLEAMPEVGAIGGVGIPVTDGIQPPEWFKDYYSTYAVGPQAEKSGIKTTGTLWGAGLTTRRSLYFKMYEHYTSFLLQSDKDLIFAEDTEYCLRLLAKGYGLYYDKELKYHHFISESKLTPIYKDNLREKYHMADQFLEKYYLAIKFGPKNKLSLLNRIRLSIITPIRYFRASSDAKKEKQRTIMSYLLPIFVQTDPLTAQIKEFIIR